MSAADADAPLGANPRPVMFGCEGLKLTAIEHSLFRDAKPFGFILFKRNCENRDQVRQLIKEMKIAAGRDDIAIAIDQEGGRVARLQPPHWPKYPAARAFGLMYENDPGWGLEAIRLYGRLLAHELSGLGVTINCAPVLDLYDPAGTPALGDRAFSPDPEIVAALAQALCEAFMAGGLLPVIKHLPGHGRLKKDPHHVLPVIDAARAVLSREDFAPFQKLKDMPLGMNSHAVFADIDDKNPASLSSIINQEIIRREIGFDGLLLSDDITMKALRGNVGDLARRILAAGNDIVLHCCGDSSEMEAIVRAVEPMSDATWTRWQQAQERAAKPDFTYNLAADAARLDVLLGGLAAIGAEG